MVWDRRAVLLALGAVAAAPTVAAAQRPADPSRPIRHLEATLAGAADALPGAGAVRAAVTRTFDMDAIARAILAGLAPGATEEQIGRFRQALTDRIVRDLMNRRRRDGRGTLVIAGTRDLGAGEWLVTSRLRIPQQNDRIISWQVRTGPRGPLIRDVRGGGTSMVRVLRNEYAPALRRIELDGLIARMEARSRARR